MVSLALAASAATDPRASRLYEEALQLFEKNDTAGAIIQLKNALQIDRTALAAQLLLGRALWASGDPVGAEVAFAEALKLGVNRSEVVVPLARALIAQSRHQDVLSQERFSPAGLPPGIQAELLLIRAAALSDVGRAKEALTTLQEARALAPASPNSWASEVPIRIRSGQFKEAAAAADRALQLAPGSPEALYLKGSVAHASSRIKDAIDAYDKALKIDPGHLEALIARAGILLDLNRTQDALKDIAEVRRSAPRDPRGALLAGLIAERNGDTAAKTAALHAVTAMLDTIPVEFLRFRPQALMAGGLAHFGLGQKEKAMPYLEMLARQHPSSPGTKLFAEIHIINNNPESAIEVLETYLRSHPGDPEALILLASAQLGVGRAPRATQILEQGLRVQDSSRLRMALGLSLVQGGKPADAVVHLESAFRKDPAQSKAGTLLATIYLRGGQPKKAREIVDLLVKREPGNADYRNLQGLVAGQSGDEKGAQAAFEQALKLNPRLHSASINLAKLETGAGKLEAAMQRLRAVLALDDKNIEALMSLATLSERTGNIADATRFFEKAADLSGPKDLNPGRALVAYHIRGKRLPAAVEAVKQLTQKAPDDTNVLLSNATVSLAQNDLSAAKIFLTRANRSPGADAPTLVKIAYLQLSAGDPKGAAYSVDKALQLSPGFTPAVAMAADVDIRLGDLSKAEQRARELVAKLPKSGVGHALLGDVASARRQPAQALVHYQRAHEIDANSESLLRLFNVQWSSNQRGALAIAEAWLNKHPADAAVWRAVADAHARSGSLKAAGTAYAALIKAEPTDADALNNYAQVLIGLKEPQALKIAERALALRPDLPHVVGTAGWAALQFGSVERALQLLRDARLRDPANSETRYYLARALAKVGRNSEARDELQMALRSPGSLSNPAEAQALLATLK